MIIITAWIFYTHAKYHNDPQQGFFLFSGRVVECRACECEVAGSNLTSGYCAPTPTQHAISPLSANEYRGEKQESKRAYHSLH